MGYFAYHVGRLKLSINTFLVTSQSTTVCSITLYKLYSACDHTQLLRSDLYTRGTTEKQQNKEKHSFVKTYTIKINNNSAELINENSLK